MDQSWIDAINASGPAANIQMPKKEGESTAGGKGAISGDPEDPGQAGWSQAAQAQLMGGSLSKDKDSLVHGVNVPGAAAGVGGKDWLTRGALQVGSNILGKMCKKAPARADAAIGY